MIDTLADLKPFTDSLDLWLAATLGLDMVLGGGISVPKEGSMADEEDPMASVFTALTAGLSEDQIITLRRLVTAHMTFLAGLLQAADPEG